MSFQFRDVTRRSSRGTFSPNPLIWRHPTVTQPALAFSQGREGIGFALDCYMQTYNIWAMRGTLPVLCGGDNGPHHLPARRCHDDPH